MSDEKSGIYPNLPPGSAQQQQQPANGYPPPPASGYQPQYGQQQQQYGQQQYGQPQPAQTVIITAPQPVFVQTRRAYSKFPEQINCPQCGASVVTRTTHTVGGMTWLACGGICLVGLLFCPLLLLGCQFIPFCVDGAKDVKHHCPNCNAMVGSRSAL